MAAKLAKEKLPKQEEDFVWAVLGYFPDFTFYKGDGYSSGATDLLKRVNRMTSPDNILSIIDEVIEEHRRSWSNVSETFATLKIKISQLR